MSSSRPNAFFGGGASAGNGVAGVRGDRCTGGAETPRAGVGGGADTAGRGGGVGRLGTLIGGGVGMALPGSLNLKSDGGGAAAGAGPPGRELGSAPARRSIVPRLPSGAGPSNESRFLA